MRRALQSQPRVRPVNILRFISTPVNKYRVLRAEAGFRRTSPSSVPTRKPRAVPGLRSVSALLENAASQWENAAR